MTLVGAGGVVIAEVQSGRRFERDFKRLSPDLKTRVEEKLVDLQSNPRPPGIGFEKLKGYSNPDIYTIHITGNYKVSFSIEAQTAYLRRVGNHDEIDRAP